MTEPRQNKQKGKQKNEKLQRVDILVLCLEQQRQQILKPTTHHTHVTARVAADYNTNSAAAAAQILSLSLTA